MRVKLIIQYKGTRYHGWQVQPGRLTIQETLQTLLSKFYNTKIIVVASGRTDSGVHALAQVCHFDYEAGHGEPRRTMSNPARLLIALNSLLPDDISVLSAEAVPETFHAQKSVKKKIYDYQILNSPIPSPFLNDYAWNIPYPLDVKKMRQASKILVGEHDFKSFCASDSKAKTTVRKIYSICHSRGSRRESTRAHDGFPPTTAGMTTVSITGSGFFKQMVRNIVGTLVDVGRGKMTLTEFKKAFKSCDRRRMGRTAPAKGLCLRKVVY